MGKSNRIRAYNAEKKMANTVKPVKKKGMPSWLSSTIAAVLAVVILAVCVMGVLSSNGVIMRHRYPIRTENFKISANMMTYFYQAQIQTFTSDYQSYLSYFSLDTNKSLKDQVYGDDTLGMYEESLLGEFDGTWFDYFMSLATKQASQILMYCEEAKARGLELDESDIAEIDSSLSSLTSTGTLLGYTTDTYIASMYGAGIKEKDIRDAMELTLLAEKGMNAIQEEVLTSITHDDIHSKFDADKKLFQLVDYSYYTISVKYDEVAKEILGSNYTQDELKAKETEVNDAYTARINEAKELANALKSTTTPDDFMKIVNKTLAEDHYDTQYATIDVAAEKIPAEDIRAAIKTALVEKLLVDLSEDKAETDTVYSVEGEKYTLFGNEVTKEFAEAIEKLENSCYTSLLTDQKTYILEKVYFSESDEFLKWAFDDARVANETYSKFDGDGKDSATVTNENGAFTANVFILKNTRYRDEALTKNVAYIVFGTEDAAKNACTELGKVTLSEEEFGKVADALSATAHSTIMDYTEGTFQIDAFDEWLYADTTVKGSYTTTPIKADDKTFIVAYYFDDGIASWEVTVKSAIFSEKYETYYNGMLEKHTLTIKDKLLSKIDG